MTDTVSVSLRTSRSAVEDARLAMAAGRPVSLRWTRKEESTWAYFRPGGVIDIAAGLSKDNALTAWEQINYNSGEWNTATRQLWLITSSFFL